MNKTIFRLDAEHSTLRLVVLAIFVATGVIAYVVLNQLIQSDGINLVAFFGALLIGYGVSYVVERILKGRWHSGRVIELEPNGTIRLVKNGDVEGEIRPAEGVNVLTWRFEVAKRARVPKGWSVVALALEHDGTYLPLYTFMSPSQMTEFDPNGHFRLLKGKKSKPTEHPLRDSNSLRDLSPMRDDLRLAGEERRLNEAESARWANGAEMTREDFVVFEAWVRQHYVEWMIQ